MVANWVAGNPAAPSEEWARRVEAILRHYRQTLRLPRWWTDRTRCIAAVRLGVQDDQGIRGPSQPFSDFARIRLSHNPSVKSEEDPLAPLIQNVDGWADRLEDCSPAPAELSVLDAEHGIIHLDYQSRSQHELVLPGQLESVTGTDQTLFEGNPGLLRLADEHRIALVLTLEPVSRYYTVDVPYGSCTGETLPADATTNGRTLELEAEADDARIAWTDALGDTIKALFDEQQPDAQPPTPMNATALGELAKAIATRIYLSLRDTIAGTVTYPGLHAIVPSGRRSSVTWTIAPDGETSTLVRVDEPRIPDLESLLPPSLQRLYLQRRLPKGR
jgi:hypothetical protein